MAFKFYLLLRGSFMKIIRATYDILRGVNATVWGGVQDAEKVGKIVKTGLSGADVVIGTSHALEDFGCNDYVCASLDVIGSVSITVGCRSVRYYCKQYGTFWGCTVATGQGIKEAIKFTIKR